MSLRHTRMTTLFILTAGIAMMMADPTFGKAREPILAGSWYPSDPDRLRAEVTEFLDLGGDVLTRATAVIVPHAGYRFSGPTAGQGFASVRGRSFERVILLGPSHRVRFEGAALPDNDAWRTPLGEVPIDLDAIATLAGNESYRINPDAHAREHCLEIEIPFLQVALSAGFQIVPIVIGRVNEETAERIAGGLESILTERTLVVVSSDFTHFGPDYGYVPFREKIEEGIHKLDQGAVHAIETISADQFRAYRQKTGITVCGAEPIGVLLTLLRGRGGKFEKLGYTTSGEILDDYQNSVSYVAMAYSPDKDGGRSPAAEAGALPSRMLNETEKSFLLHLARDTIVAQLKGDPLPTREVGEEFASDSPLREVRGLFVTLNKNDRLRGCMGNILGSKKLINGVSEQALVSAFEDPRFPAVRLDEVDALEIEISVLTPLVSVAGPEEIEVGRHGVVIEKHGRRAVFLPQVAVEQGWDRDTMLSRLCQKAGLSPGAWRSGMDFQVFEAQVFGEATGD